MDTEVVEEMVQEEKAESIEEVVASEEEKVEE